MGPGSACQPFHGPCPASAALPRQGVVSSAQRLPTGATASRDGGPSRAPAGPRGQRALRGTRAPAKLGQAQRTALGLGARRGVRFPSPPAEARGLRPTPTRGEPSEPHGQHKRAACVAISAGKPRDGWAEEGTPRARLQRRPGTPRDRLPGNPGEGLCWDSVLQDLPDPHSSLLQGPRPPQPARSPALAIQQILTQASAGGTREGTPASTGGSGRNSAVAPPPTPGVAHRTWHVAHSTRTRGQLGGVASGVSRLGGRRQTSPAGSPHRATPGEEPRRHGQSNATSRSSGRSRPGRARRPQRGV